MIFLLVLPSTVLVVLASSASGDLLSLRCADHHPYQDWRRVETAGSRYARDDKEPGTQLEETITRKAAS
jgi:hypothetical protein